MTHNGRRHRRGSKNLFWLVNTRRIGLKEPILFNRKPHLETYPNAKYLDNYKDKKFWFSIYGQSYPPIGVLERFPEAKETPIPVKLFVVEDNPDMYIQRYKDSLFINNRLETYYTYGILLKHKHVRVPHNNRISNRLFTDSAKEGAIVGVKIEKITEPI